MDFTTMLNDEDGHVKDRIQDGIVGAITRGQYKTANVLALIGIMNEIHKLWRAVDDMSDSVCDIVDSKLDGGD